MMSPTAATEIESLAGVGETLTIDAAVDDSVCSATTLLFVQAPPTKTTAAASGTRKGNKNFLGCIFEGQKSGVRSQNGRLKPL
jgi:hypothetical protein